MKMTVRELVDGVRWLLCCIVDAEVSVEDGGLERGHLTLQVRCPEEVLGRLLGRKKMTLEAVRRVVAAIGWRTGFIVRIAVNGQGVRNSGKGVSDASDHEVRPA